MHSRLSFAICPVECVWIPVKVEARHAQSRIVELMIVGAAVGHGRSCVSQENENGVVFGVLVSLSAKACVRHAEMGRYNLLDLFPYHHAPCSIGTQMFLHGLGSPPMQET